MNFQPIEEIAEAVLYEGYMLYPYRPSAVKNRQRFNFGVLCPPSYCELHPGSESSLMQTECLLKTTHSTRLTVRVRFLQIVRRSVGKRMPPLLDGMETDELEVVDRLEVDGRVYQPWQEAEERAITYDALDPATLVEPRVMEFNVPGVECIEELIAGSEVAGVLLRSAEPLAGALHLRSERCGDDVVKLTLRLENRTAFCCAQVNLDREEALLHSLVAAHLILGAEDGEFLSLLDPPPEYEELARGCRNIGNWPVLAGEDANAMLASPIILYDYPKIAPESAGNLFDGTEIDEILSLRILTLTDEEKREIRASDDRARALLDRTESIPEEQFMKLHGVLRGLTAVDKIDEERP